MESIIRPELLTLTNEQFQALIPYFAVFGGTLLALVFSVIKAAEPKWPVFVISLLTVVAGLAASQMSIHGPSTLLFNSMMVSDVYSNLFNMLFLASAGFSILASIRYLDRESLQHPEYYVLMLLASLGMMLMASALDLMVIFIALETMSLAVYILVGFRRADRRSNEAAMKYFILGSAASAILLYGTALLYGATGTLNIRDILALVTQANAAADAAVPAFQVTPMFSVGAWLVILGFLFKVASVPFHMWMPDVYEGAPTPVTGFMTTGLKAAAFATFVRVFVSLGFGRGLEQALETHLHHLMWASAVLTMVIGNVIALTQTNLKRMLAYSSIAHSGYLLVGMIAGAQSEQGMASVIFYLISYAAMNLGAFAVLTIIAQKNDFGLNLQDVAGLHKRHPVLAFSLAVFLLSMAGIPPTAGFAAKYLLFASAVQAGEIPLVVISVLCSAISVYYYLRVLVYVYMRDPEGSTLRPTRSVWAGLVVASMVAITLQVGVLPGQMVAVARKAMSSL